MKAAVRLMESALDYAGTFPPARLDLAEALRNYARYRAGPHASLLGRFLVPAAKLREFEETAGAALPAGGSVWPLSVIVSSEPLRDIQRSLTLGDRLEGRIRIASFEAPPLEPARVGAIAARLPQGVEAYFEVPLGEDFEERLAAVAAAGASAKVRTGGLSADVFPTAADISRFLFACAQRGVAFKATAGLHHPFFCRRPVEGGAEGEEADMHGFLNLAAAACFIQAGMAAPEEVTALLAERSPEAIGLRDEALEWRGKRLGPDGIAEARRRFFRSFGTCSFEEPIADLERYGLL